MSRMRYVLSWLTTDDGKVADEPYREKKSSPVRLPHSFTGSPPAPHLPVPSFLRIDVSDSSVARSQSSPCLPSLPNSRAPSRPSSPRSTASKSSFARRFSPVFRRSLSLHLMLPGAASKARGAVKSSGSERRLQEIDRPLEPEGAAPLNCPAPRANIAHDQIQPMDPRSVPDARPRGHPAVPEFLPRPPRERFVSDQEAGNERGRRRPPIALRDSLYSEATPPSGSRRMPSDRSPDALEETTAGRGRTARHLPSDVATTNARATAGTEAAADREPKTPSKSAKKDLQQSRYLVGEVPSWAEVQEAKMRAALSPGSPGQIADQK